MALACGVGERARVGALGAGSQLAPASLAAPHAAGEERRICEARRRTNLGTGRLAGLVGDPRSTMWAVLARHQLSRRPRGQRQTFKRYEWSQPGALLHMDVKRLARFAVPGHCAMGRAEQHKTRGAGWVYLHVVIDDHSRYLYVEQHAREDAITNADCLARAIDHFAELGLARPQAGMTGQRQGLRLPPSEPCGELVEVFL